MKRGFTLIELMAVILILGIIALIAVPTVGNIIDDATTDAGKESVNNYIRAVEDNIALKTLKGINIDDGLYSKNELADVKTRGRLDNAFIEIRNGKIVSGSFCAFDRAYSYDGTTVIYQKYQTNCETSERINSKVVSIVSNNGGVNGNYMFITEDGNLYGMGYNNYGVLGVNQPEYVDKPTRINNGYKFKKVDVSARGTGIGITNDNDLVIWGFDGDYYSLLNGATTPSYLASQPTKVNTNIKFKDISIIEKNIYAISTDGDIYYAGKKFDGTNTNIRELTLLSEGNFKKVYSDAEYAYFIDENGDVWTIGRSGYSSYLLGNNPSSIPTKATTGLNIKEIFYRKQTSGSNQYYAINNNGEVYFWGFNTGVADLQTSAYITNPYKLTSASKVPYQNVTSIASVSNNVFYFVVNNRVYRVNNYNNNYNTDEIKFSENISSVATICGVSDNLLFLSTNGNLYTYGDLRAASGVGSLEIYTEPHEVTFTADDIFVKSSYNITTLNQGNVYFWGKSYKDSITSPKLLKTGVSSIFGDEAAAYAGIYALDSTGNLSGGFDAYAPTQAKTAYASNFANVATSSLTSATAWNKTYSKFVSNTYTTFAITTDGKLYGWGNNKANAISSASTSTNYSTPQLIFGSEKVKDIKANNNNGYIITEDGKLYAVGTNNYGQLGNGTNTASTSYIHVMDNIKDVYVGNSYQVFALTKDGDIYFFGKHTAGYYGLAGANILTPQKIDTDIEFDKIIGDVYIAKNGDAYIFGTGYAVSGNSTSLNKLSIKVKQVFSFNSKKYVVTPNGILYKVDGSKFVKIMDNVTKLYGSTSIMFIKTNNGKLYAMGNRSNNIIEPYNTSITRPVLLSLN